MPCIHMTLMAYRLSCLLVILLNALFPMTALLEYNMVMTALLEYLDY